MLINNQKKPAKEATKSERFIHEENKRTLRFYRYLIFGSFLLFSVVAFFTWSTFRDRYGVLASLTLVVTCFAYKFMSYMATPSYAENDRGVLQLQDAGLDLNIGSGGIAEHAKDTILLCCITSMLALLHHYFWVLLLLIPSRLFHLLWVNILSPWIFDPNQGPQVNEKKQKKMERKMRRVGHLTQGRS